MKILLCAVVLLVLVFAVTKSVVSPSVDSTPVVPSVSKRDLCTTKAQAMYYDSVEYAERTNQLTAETSVDLLEIHSRQMNLCYKTSE